MTELTNTEFYKSLIDDLDAVKTQLVKDAREATMQVSWMMGKRILEEKENLQTTFGEQYIPKIAKDLGVSDSTIRHAIKFAEKFSEFEDVYKLKEGENISYRKIVHQYLYDSTERKNIKCELTNCPNCNKKIKHNKI